MRVLAEVCACVSMLCAHTHAYGCVFVYDRIHVRASVHVCAHFKIFIIMQNV